MTTIRIKLGDALSFDSPQNKKLVPDDRQQTIEVMGGVAVQDYGHVEAGDKVSFSATFNAAAWALISGYWDNRTKVTFIDEDGTSYANCRVVVKSWTHRGRFPSYVVATLEIWRV